MDEVPVRFGDIERMGPRKAGGVRTLDRLLEVRALGVTRVGATQTAAILEECKRRLGI